MARHEGEFEYIDWIRRRTVCTSPVRVGPGDDCAVIAAGGREDEVLTVDMILDGTHFDGRKLSPRAIGRKALAVSLSDVAAMGFRPTLALVSVAFPRRAQPRLRHALYAGMHEIAQQFSVAIVGGNVTAWDKPLAISTTVIGRGPAGRAVLRSGAREGDCICVTGELGGSMLGKHHRFTPRVREGLAIRRRFKPHAMIDVSDGLLADVGHILRESRCGGVLFEENIPISDAARAAARKSGKSPLEHALTDGEDYELVVVLPARSAARLVRARPNGTPVCVIGRIGGRGLRLRGVNCIERPVKGKGYAHF